MKESPAKIALFIDVADVYKKNKDIVIFKLLKRGVLLSISNKVFTFFFKLTFCSVFPINYAHDSKRFGIVL